MKIRRPSLREEYSHFGEVSGGGTGVVSDYIANAPVEFKEEMNDLRSWALRNEKAATRDLRNFWILKIPAIIVSASAATLAHYKMDVAATVAAGLVSACVLIDGLRPLGLLHDAHHRTAAHVNNLHASMASEYRQGILRGEESCPLAARILESSKKERAQINAYIIQAESSALRDHHSLQDSQRVH